MIRTATQLKAKVRNLSGGDNKKAQTLIRNFIMERFLERIALSQYRNNFILKGGMLGSTVLDLQQLHALADLPSKDVLIGQVVRTIAAPISGLVNVLSGTVRGLVTCLAQIRDKKDAA